MANHYAYAELRKAAINNGTPEDIAALVEWMEQHGSSYWNGEYYDIDDGLRLRPIYNWDAHTQEEIDDGLQPDGWEVV